MYPAETTQDAGKKPKVRRYPYIIVPLEPPSSPIPDGALYMETLVFSLHQYPASKVLDDYCKAKGLDSSKFVCHPVVFAKDLKRNGKGTLCIQRGAEGFRGRINWRR